MQMTLRGPVLVTAGFYSGDADSRGCNDEHVADSRGLLARLWCGVDEPVRGPALVILGNDEREQFAVPKELQLA
jgi:hypothetical protein